MPFTRIKGVKGLVWSPEPCGAKKHRCQDCYCCQWCSDERCTLCQRSKKKTAKKKAAKTRATKTSAAKPNRATRKRSAGQ